MKDWKLNAAREIHLQFDLKEIAPQDTSVPRIAAIIAKHYDQIVKPEPGHIQDWAAKAGAYLHAEGVRVSSHRIAAVIAHFAEPLVKLLQESKRSHSEGEDGRRECNKIKYEDEEEPCTCGADEWNKKIDEVLNG